ncbi:MAG: redoxin domain-containing protein, partial [Miltoncostaeaceae bacterium]
MAVEIGAMAPDFTLQDPTGTPVSLSSFRGRRNVVLIFYPGAFSEFCTSQFRDLSAIEERYALDGDAQVIGVSVDSRYTQGRFAGDLGLTDTIMLADFFPKGEVARAYGVFSPDYDTAGRATFIIDTGGVVRGRMLT